MSTNTQKLQNRIYKKYGKKRIEAESERLCRTCARWFSGYAITSVGHCKGGLLPITSTGDPCPYYEERKETE